MTDASPWVPDSRSVRRLAAAAACCEGCELHLHATQTVFGSGPRQARLMLVGEQPGDVEDREGEVFVGPAGRVLDEALVDADIVRADVYVTNAVKHFRYRQQGKRRLHETPRVPHINACRPWLAAELRAVRPELVVAMGAVAVQSLLGPGARVMRDRGSVTERETLTGPAQVLITVHPSSVLRIDPQQRKTAFDALVADLRVAAAALG
jgi:uracil-DNA glycosylase family protein